MHRNLWQVVSMVTTRTTFERGTLIYGDGGFFFTFILEL